MQCFYILSEEKMYSKTYGTPTQFALNRHLLKLMFPRKLPLSIKSAIHFYPYKASRSSLHTRSYLDRELVLDLGKRDTRSFDGDLEPHSEEARFGHSRPEGTYL